MMVEQCTYAEQELTPAGCILNHPRGFVADRKEQRLEVGRMVAEGMAVEQQEVVQTCQHSGKGVGDADWPWRQDCIHLS